MRSLGAMTFFVCFVLAATAHANDAKQILKESGIRGGPVAHLGSGDGPGPSGEQWTVAKLLAKCRPRPQLTSP